MFLPNVELVRIKKTAKRAVFWEILNDIGLIYRERLHHAI
jgi:hypothetical protein